MTPFDNFVTVQPCEDSDRKKVESSPVCTCVNQIYDRGEPFMEKKKPCTVMDGYRVHFSFGIRISKKD